MPDNEDEYTLAIIPFESIDFPESFQYGESYEIPYTYFRTSTCQGHDGIIYSKHGNTRVLHIQNIVYKNNCIALNNQVYEGAFTIEVQEESHYLFKYYIGKDEDGSSMYQEVLVPVE